MNNYITYKTIDIPLLACILISNFKQYYKPPYSLLMSDKSGAAQLHPKVITAGVAWWIDFLLTKAKLQRRALTIRYLESFAKIT